MTISSPGEVVAAYLVAEGLATRPVAPNQASVWPVTVTVLPTDMPDNRIVVTSADFENQGKSLRTGEQHGSWIVQIRVRSKPARDAHTKIQAIMANLATVKAVDVVTDLAETVTLVSCTLVSGPSDMGQEEKNQRQHYAMNWKCVIVPGE